MMGTTRTNELINLNHTYWTGSLLAQLASFRPDNTPVTLVELEPIIRQYLGGTRVIEVLYNRPTVNLDGNIIN